MENVNVNNVNVKVVVDGSQHCASYFDSGLLSLIGHMILASLIVFVTFGVCTP